MRRRRLAYVKRGRVAARLVAPENVQRQWAAFYRDSAGAWREVGFSDTRGGKRFATPEAALAAARLQITP